MSEPPKPLDYQQGPVDEDYQLAKQRRANAVRLTVIIALSAVLTVIVLACVLVLMATYGKLLARAMSQNVSLCLAFSN